MSKGTKRRSIRIEDDLWDEAQGKAAARGDNLSDIIRQALRDYNETRGVPTNDRTTK